MPPKRRPSREWSAPPVNIPTSGPRLRQALVTACGRISTLDSYIKPTQVIRVDGSPVIVHLLRGLHSVGMELVVVTGASRPLAAEVRRHDFGGMQVKFVLSTSLSTSSSWKLGHASNILPARSMFDPASPLLLLLSAHIFAWPLLERCATASLPDGCLARVLIDDDRDEVSWATNEHCGAHCKDGKHCGALVKVLKGENGLVSRIGKRLSCFDGLEAGVYLVKHAFFEVLHGLQLSESNITLPEAVQSLTEDGRAAYLTTGGLEWFGEPTVTSLPTPIYSQAIKPEWRDRALRMLRSASGGVDEVDENISGAAAASADSDASAASTRREGGEGGVSIGGGPISPSTLGSHESNCLCEYCDSTL
jgi:choline kinase